MKIYLFAIALNLKRKCYGYKCAPTFFIILHFEIGMPNHCSLRYGRREQANQWTVLSKQSSR